MYTKKFSEDLEKELARLKDAGTYKTERLIESTQGATVTVGEKPLLMFAANNYLGLANHPEILKAAKEGMEKYGYGTASVRFISGTQTIHRELEQKLAAFLGTEDAILYSTNFMANLGFFASVVNEPFGNETYMDAVYSDELNHASIIDALKLMKRDKVVKRIYPHGDILTLRKMLEEDKDKNYRHKIIATDGVFSMEGYLAKLPEIKTMAEEFGALLFVDDAHAVGVLGTTGAGTAEHLGLHGKIDVLSGTFGKALGGALGGYIAGSTDLVNFLRQKSRTYMFSNALPGFVCTAAIRAIELLSEEKELLARVKDNTRYFREGVKKLGFTILEGEHPIVPVMIGDAKKTQEMSKALLAEGLYVTGLWFPVVPEGEARLRFQVSAAHSKENLDAALQMLAKIK
jgi:glycine C-acetyltransferase